MMEAWITNSGILIAGGLIFLAVIYLAVIRNIEAQRISKKFDKNDILLVSFGVNFYGLETEPGGLLRSTGVLALLKNGLYYRARYSKREVFIPGHSIKKIEVVDFHKGKPIHLKVFGIQFINENKTTDRAAFRMPYPDRWASAIKSHFQA
ncbi:MAG: hypothetical protein AB1798_18140 [Spirochaetota bacterium]